MSGSNPSKIIILAEILPRQTLLGPVHQNLTQANFTWSSAPKYYPDKLYLGPVHQNITQTNFTYARCTKILPRQTLLGPGAPKY